MTSDNLTYNHRTTRHSSRQSLASPYPPAVASTTTPQPATSSRLRDPSVCDIFSSLLFDRQSAYQSASSAASAPLSVRKTGTQVHHTPPVYSKSYVGKEKTKHISQGHHTLPGHLNSAMISRAPAVSTKRGRPAKQTSTKDAGKTAVEKPRKRAAPARVTLRALKRQKPAANIKQKLDLKGSMGNTLTIASKVISDKDIEIITISDSEDEAYEPIRKDRTDLSEDKDMGFGAPKMKIHEDDDDVQPNIPNSLANPQPTRNATKRSPFAPFYPTPRWAFSGLDVSESESDLHPKPSRNSQKDMARTEKDHKNETQQLREQLDAAKAELDRVKMLHEKERSDGELIQVRSSNIAREEVQRLQQELEAVRGSMTTAVRERDQLRIDVENSRAGSDQLTKELQEERQSRQSERSENESIVEDLIKSREPTSDTANDFLVVENGRLRTENESLRAAATRPPPIPQPCFPPTSAHNFTPPSSQLFQASIYPSLFASDPSQPSQTFSPTPPSAIIEERKEENVRKHYTKVKRRLEDLQLVTRNLTKSTRGMDLSSFGDFGNHLRQLRTALEVEAKPGVEKQEDEDAK